MNKTFLLWGGILAMLSVAIGAFGAHGLKDLLLEYQRTATFETAVKYQFYRHDTLICHFRLTDEFHLFEAQAQSPDL